MNSARTTSCARRKAVTGSTSGFRPLSVAGNSVCFAGAKARASSPAASKDAPLRDAPASVTVIAPTCAAADGWATALMVLGPGKGGELARAMGIGGLFLLRAEGDRIRARRVGRVFGDEQAATGYAEG